MNQFFTNFQSVHNVSVISKRSCTLSQTRPPAGQSCQNLLWSLESHLLDYCQLIGFRNGWQDLTKSSPDFQGVIWIINIVYICEMPVIWRKIFFCLSTLIGNVEVKTLVNFLAKLWEWEKSPSISTLSRILLQKGRSNPSTWTWEKLSGNRWDLANDKLV